MRVQVSEKSDDLIISIHQEASRRERLLDGLRWLEESGAILRGHFKFGDGDTERHGGVYISGRRLFSVPYASKWLTQSLLDVIPVEIQNKVEFVAGPQTAGIIMARDLADFITSARKKGEPQVEAVFLDKDGDGGYLLHESDQARMNGRHVILVDDVRHRGATFAACVRIMLDFGARVLGTAELIERGLPVLPQNVPNFFVGQLDPDQLYRPSECPKCKADEPITKF